MYMGPIAAAKPASPLILRRMIGVAVLLMAAIVMLPWLLGNALAILCANAPHAFRSAADMLIDMVDHAGRVTLGR